MIAKKKLVEYSIPMETCADSILAEEVEQTDDVTLSFHCKAFLTLWIMLMGPIMDVSPPRSNSSQSKAKSPVATQKAAPGR